MGYVGATVKLDHVRSRMKTSRNAVKREYTNSKMQRFCDDSEAFNWACRCYRYFYESFNGNVPNITSETFAGYYYTLTDKTEYQYIMGLLKEDLDFGWTETRYLIDMMKKLRQRYR